MQEFGGRADGDRVGGGAEIFGARARQYTPPVRWRGDCGVGDLTTMGGSRESVISKWFVRMADYSKMERVCSR